MKTVSELSREQMIELKQNYLDQHLLEVEDRGISYDELANADNIVSDDMIFQTYDSFIFSDDDFCCTAQIPLF